ncbi:UDP-glucose/GDP-mannose dehydrogenase family protein [Paenibacillus glycanilyticus]|uniref:UDP-glucose dehydrogenase family protein n=1 Tax=Paenibacillus glycanilyticus TaxID=126569 RepID=UPI00203B9880|nr:UDP-glucose/GDP-mannose dehydrogenase family protein [Paenibacillus glycanilyticus]MCM3630982.1 UDP-glucose/GDP-mannose dehydrogenase family protein [Paenibacillus glycanilyticus]
MRKIAMIGTGYVGLVNGTCLAHIGHSVQCCDTNSDKIEWLQQGRIPIYEPGLEALVADNVAAGRLSFTSNMVSAIEQSDLLFIAVGTPMAPTGAADLGYIQAVAEFIGCHLTAYKTIVIKSTVPVGTGRKVENWIRENMPNPHIPFDVVSNPEFLREGSAVADFMNMERCIVGALRPEAAQAVADCFEPLGTRTYFTSNESAEMIKYAANAFLATKISFINAIANLCERYGADVEDVAEGIGSDSRIGSAFLQAGIGYGGSCFPKDTHALNWMADQAGYNFGLLKEVIQTNEEQKYMLLKKLVLALGDLRGTTIAVLGLSFKPNTDDLRDAPSLALIPALIAAGANVRVYDPVAMPEARKWFGSDVIYGTGVYQTISGCDACMILTEWREFITLDLEQVRQLLKRPIVVDGRNCYPLESMSQHAIEYHSIGRAAIHVELSENQYLVN